MICPVQNRLDRLALRVPLLAPVSKTDPAVMIISRTEYCTCSQSVSLMSLSPRRTAPPINDGFFLARFVDDATQREAAGRSVALFLPSPRAVATPRSTRKRQRSCDRNRRPPPHSAAAGAGITAASTPPVDTVTDKYIAFKQELHHSNSNTRTLRGFAVPYTLLSTHSANQASIRLFSTVLYCPLRKRAFREDINDWQQCRIIQTVFSPIFLRALHLTSASSSFAIQRHEFVEGPNDSCAKRQRRRRPKTPPPPKKELRPRLRPSAPSSSSRTDSPPHIAL